MGILWTKLKNKSLWWACDLLWGHSPAKPACFWISKHQHVKMVISLQRLMGLWVTTCKCSIYVSTLGDLLFLFCPASSFYMVIILKNMTGKKFPSIYRTRPEQTWELRVPLKFQPHLLSPLPHPSRHLL